MQNAHRRKQESLKTTLDETLSKLLEKLAPPWHRRRNMSRTSNDFVHSMILCIQCFCAYILTFLIERFPAFAFLHSQDFDCKSTPLMKSGNVEEVQRACGRPKKLNRGILNASWLAKGKNTAIKRQKHSEDWTHPPI